MNDWGARRGIADVAMGADAQFAVAAAREAATRWGHPAVDPAHLLFGLLQRAPESLPGLGEKDAEVRIRRSIEASGVGPIESPNPVPFTDHLRKVLAYSREAALGEGSHEVRPPHILEALRVHGDATSVALLGGTA